jgi:glucan-binding YG repeat protein
MLRKTSPDNILITGNFTSGKEYKFGLALALAYHNETNNFFMGNEDSNYPIVVTFSSNGVKFYKNNNGNYTEITNVNITATPKKGWIEINDTKPITKDAGINDFVYIKDGKMATGFITVGTNKEIYYLSEKSDDNISKGVMVRGWKAINGKWYYFSNGKQTIYGNEYKDGQLVTGWFQYTDGRWYYLDPKSNPKGQMVTGFKKVNSKWYYFAPKTISSESIVGGQMMSKNVTIDGKTFTIGTNGVVMD